MELADRVVLVTGAAQRVGRAIAVRLAEAGCHVAIHYRTSAESATATAERCQQAGVQAHTFAADFTETDQTIDLIPRVLDRFGRLDVLVNNASTFEPMTIDDFTPANWERTIRVNLTAPMTLAHAARASLRQARGRIVNLSDAATSRPWPAHLAYMVSKGALDTLTRVLARSFAPDVNVVGVAPGVAAWPDNYDEQTRDHLTTRIPLRRAGTPEDIAAAVHFILRDGDYITGVILPIDGGRQLG